MLDNKIVILMFTKWTSVSIRNYLSKGLILPDSQKQIYNHMIKYIIFESSSSKYNKAFQYYLYLKRNILTTEVLHSAQQCSCGWLHINTAGRNKKPTGDRVARVTSISSSRTDSKPNGSWLWLGYLRVGDDVIDKHCITLVFLVQFKLIRYPCLDLPLSPCSVSIITLTLHWADDQHSPAGLEPRLEPDLHLP